MSKLLPVRYENKLAYEIVMEQDFLALNAKLSALGYEKTSKICIVSDSNVAKLYTSKLKKLLKNDFFTIVEFVFEAGEASKNLDTVEKLYEELIINHFDRRDLLIALGGGVVGDLTGFTASTYLRGIDFIQIPTSLLSQVDSSIGGKTGVDFKNYKNMVGAFYQPKLVYMNLSVLTTLPRQQLSSGLAEIIKHGCIKDKAYFTWLKEHMSDVFAMDMDVLEKMIYRSCQIKRDVVERDPKEKGERALLNFGHTIGHAVEKLADFTLYHGECVAIGMAAAAYLSVKKGLIPTDDMESIKSLLQEAELPLTVKNQDSKAILAATKNDKKMEAGRIKFILLHAVGDAYIDMELSDEELLEAISCVLE